MCSVPRGRSMDFVDQYKHVTNNLACVLRAFQDVDCLVTFLLAAAILGVHLIEPFLILTYSGNVTYRELIPAVQKLYENLTRTTDIGKLLDLSELDSTILREHRKISKKNKRAYKILGRPTKTIHLRRSYQERD